MKTTLPTHPQDRPLRILLVSDFYPPIIGGMERYVQTLGSELVRRGHRVAVATLHHKGDPSFAVESDVRVHRLNGWNRVLAPFYEGHRQFHPTVPDPGVLAEMRRVIAVERPDIIHMQGWIPYSVLPLRTLGGAKLVMTLHDYGLVCAKKTYLNQGRACTGPAFTKCVRCAVGQYGRAKSLALTTGLRLSSGLHGRVDRYLAVSEAVRAASQTGTGTPPRPMEVIPAFIADDLVETARHTPRPAFLPPNDNYILFVGALGAFKGLPVLLEAYAGLADQVPLVLIGTPQADTPQHLPPGVIMAHNVPHAQVVAAWRHSCVGVVPSLWPDPCPLVALEAMACGRAVVASSVGGLPDLIVDGTTGMLVPPGDAPALQKALRLLLDDSVLRARMGEAGRRRAKGFTASAVGERIERLYREVLGDDSVPQHAATPNWAVESSGPATEADELVAGGSLEPSDRSMAPVGASHAGT